MSKPFSIQAPEEVAKEYGGNKQRIAEAAQMGIVDPTAAVLAGMFIDRMRSAQVLEGANKPTVAQQVLGAPQPQGAGLGAMPPQMPPPAQPMMGAPMEQPMAPPMEAAPPMQEAPVGMAYGGMVPNDGFSSSFNVGGIGNLSIPDSMYDEPSNGSYSGGGLVAFADGGALYRNPEDRQAYERWAARILQRETGAKYGELNREGSGAMGIGQVMPKTGKTLASRAGLPWRPDLMLGKSKEAQEYQNKITGMALREAWNSQGGDAAKASGYYFAGPNKRLHGPKTAEYIAATAGNGAGGKGSDTRMAGTADIDTPNILARAGSFQSALSKEASPETKRRDEMIRKIEEGLSPEAQKKKADQSKWEALAQFGFNLASSKSPNFLQGVGEAASNTLPDIVEQRTAQEAAARKDYEVLTALESKSNEERRELQALALDLAKFEAGMLMDKEKLELQYKIAQMDDATRRAVTMMSGVFSAFNTAYGEAGATYRTGLATNQRQAAAELKAASSDGLDPLGGGTSGGDKYSGFSGRVVE